MLPVQFGDAARFADLLNSLRIAGPAPGSTSAGVRGARSLAGRDFGVSVHAPTRSLVVRADAHTMELVREVLGELDQEPARIEVEVLVAEVSLDHSLALGFDSILPVIVGRSAIAAPFLCTLVVSRSKSSPVMWRH